MDENSCRPSFATDGYLGAHIAEDIAAIRGENSEWFQLAEDLNRVLQAAASRAVEIHHGSSLDPNAVATRLLMRACGSLQGTILAAERGMVTEALTLARSLLEAAFCMAAMLDDPPKFVEALAADAEAARRRQAQFLVAQGLTGDDPATLLRLKEVIEEIGKQQTLSPKQLATTGPLIKLYLAYQKLSNDAAHPSAASLHRFVATTADRAGWQYRWGPGKGEEIAFALQQAANAGLAMGVGFTQLTADHDNNQKLGPLSDRLLALPRPESRLTAHSVSIDTAN